MILFTLLLGFVSDFSLFSSSFSAFFGVSVFSDLLKEDFFFSSMFIPPHMRATLRSFFEVSPSVLPAPPKFCPPGGAYPLLFSWRRQQVPVSVKSVTCGVLRLMLLVVAILTNQFQIVQGKRYPGIMDIARRYIFLVVDNHAGNETPGDSAPLAQSVCTLDCCLPCFLPGIRLIETLCIFFQLLPPSFLCT